MSSNASDVSAALQMLRASQASANGIFPGMCDIRSGRRIELWPEDMTVNCSVLVIKQTASSVMLYSNMVLSFLKAVSMSSRSLARCLEAGPSSRKFANRGVAETMVALGQTLPEVLSAILWYSKETWTHSETQTCFSCFEHLSFPRKRSDPIPSLRLKARAQPIQWVQH
ncbi:hypothetical protein ARMGADRAFT_227711 [Armillaria gallica]|uniref:Uncharacterized protein n=1 Tax=Armillaria gallica TaxID=47427 RepID=A0A2H3EPM9_ARMGA|nr:hypothetical protein ARMGADRAFT_227711 [Armillaria gallica]